MGSTQFCKGHGGGRRCLFDGCVKSAVGGGTQHCKAHGGGKRCLQEGCIRSAQDGGTQHCAAHGGGKRCQQEGCAKAVRPGTPFCIAHWRAATNAMKKPVKPSSLDLLATLIGDAVGAQPDLDEKEKEEKKDVKPPDESQAAAGLSDLVQEGSRRKRRRK